MGKLVLTRRAGESVIVREANGDEWMVKCHKASLFGYLYVTVERWLHTTRIGPLQSYSFAGGSLELRPARCPSQAILTFDFPRDVTILRTEIA